MKAEDIEIGKHVEFTDDAGCEQASGHAGFGYHNVMRYGRSNGILARLNSSPEQTSCGMPV
jgi:hypothetical protein